MKRYRRSHTDKRVAGVCGGLGEYMGVDSTILRLALIFAAALTAFVPFLIAYAVAWMVVPADPPPAVRVETGPPPRAETAETAEADPA